MIVGAMKGDTRSASAVLRLAEQVGELKTATILRESNKSYSLGRTFKSRPAARIKPLPANRAVSSEDAQRQSLAGEQLAR